MNKTLFVAIICVALFSCNDDKSEVAPPVESEKTLKLDTLYSELFEAGKFNGNVLIAENGEVIFEKSFGLADEAAKRKLNPESIFELASVSKQFTAMGIVQLAKQNKLQYEDSLSQYIPELSHYKGITIAHLLVHTSGLPDYMDLAEEHWDSTKIATNEDMIKLFQIQKPPVLFSPNEAYAYSNTGYMLLGTIIERVSGKSFGEFLKENIFAPLGMNNTLVYRRRYAPRKIDNYASAYLYSDQHGRKMLPDSMASQSYVIYLDGIVGDGMVNSTVGDLLKWDRALYTNKLVNEMDKQAIFRSYYTADSSQTDYGFGWDIGSLKVYGKVVEHSGGWAGYYTHIERHLDNDKTIIVLQNNMMEETTMPLKNTRRILYDIPVEKPIALDSAILKSYEGIYVNSKGKERKIFYKEGKLYYPARPETNVELIPVSQVKFILEGFRPEVSFTFQMDQNDQVTGCRVQQPEQGVDRTMARKE
ncbi:MAG: serine hydrolase domain-containing protein [Bacteroidota bacterium]